MSKPALALVLFVLCFPFHFIWRCGFWMIEPFTTLAQRLEMWGVEGVLFDLEMMFLNIGIAGEDLLDSIWGINHRLEKALLETWNEPSSPHD